MSKNLCSVLIGAALMAATAAPALAGDGTNLYPMISGESQMVIVFDVADARDSPLLLKGFEKLLAAKPEAKAKMAEIGIDPMKDIDTLAIAGGGVKDMGDIDAAKNMVVIIEGRLPKDKLASMPGAKKSAYKGVDVFTKDDTEVAFVADRLFFTKKGGMKAQIDLATGKAKAKSIAGSAKAKALNAALKTADTTADLWLVVLVPEKNKKDMSAQGMVANSIAAGINFTKDMAIAVRVDTNSEDSAAKAVAMIQGQLPQVSGPMSQFGLSKAAKSITVVQEKAAFKLGVTLTEAEINALLNLASGFTGGGATPAPAPAAPAPAPMAPKKTK